MFNNIVKSTKGYILTRFPEREIYLRSNGEVGYHTLSTRVQVGAVSAICLLALWFLVSVVGISTGSMLFTKAPKTNQSVEAEYERLLDDAEARYQDARIELIQQRESFELATRNFQEKHATLAQYVKQPGLQDELMGIGTGLYDSGEILMNPVIRDSSPRSARSSELKTAMLTTGTSLDQPLEQLDGHQNAYLISAEKKTLSDIELKRAIIEAADLNVDQLLRSGLLGKGGPLTSDSETLLTGTEIPNGLRINNIRARTAEAQKLDDAVNAMPLGHPVNADHYQTSSFGLRKDPFTRRPAMHRAVDIASFHKAPIVATADGTIAFVGNKGSYGRIVEIDHGYGFVTRYAHLSKSHVKRGQSVKKGDKIGSMGSSGRSTSTHLHYELQYQGERRDPNKFMKAGRYVQQN